MTDRINIVPEWPLIEVTLEIDNNYSGDVVKTTVTAIIDPPPKDTSSGDDEYEDWAYDNIFCHTGTGRDGDAAYFVEVTASSKPSHLPVGTKFEFGL